MAVSLDIQNVFNSMPWSCIMDAQENGKVLVYLCSIIQDYFRDWVVAVQTASSMIRKQIRCGVSQGVSIMCYANNTLVVIAENNISLLEQNVNATLEAMTCWIQSARLSLVAMNMEVVLFICHCLLSSVSFCLKREEIRLCTASKY